MMSVGRAKDSTPIVTKEENWVKAFLSLPIESPPGSDFLYNSAATYMVSAIVQKVTGQKLIDYLQPRLFEPLDVRGMTWETCPRGINTGGWGLALRTEHVAKFGQFNLQNGVWNGRQILPAAWVREATTFKIQQPAAKGADLEKLKMNSDWHQGYCYQFWRCRHNAFRGDGAFGQFMIVMPDQQAVIAITSQSADMQGELNLVWDHLLPGIKETALPADQEAHSRLNRVMSSLALPNDAGVKAVSFRFRRESCTFNLTDGQGQYAVQCGFGKWVDGECDMPGTPPKITVGELRPCKIAASAVWRDENRFDMIWRYYETPHNDTILCRFDGKSVRIDFLNSIPGHAETRAALIGHA